MLDDASNDAPITGDDDIVSRAVQNVADLPGEDNQYDVAATIDDEPASEVTGAGEDAATTDEPSPAANPLARVLSYLRNIIKSMISMITTLFG